MLADVTNRMGGVARDFEKGEADGTVDALILGAATASDRNWHIPGVLAA
jgi:hypothetical protein